MNSMYILELSPEIMPRISRRQAIYHRKQLTNNYSAAEAMATTADCLSKLFGQTE